jgi:uncharacterized membrane protein
MTYFPRFALFALAGCYRRSMSVETTRPQVVQRRRVSRATVLVLGVVVVPVSLGLLLNSYGPLTEQTAVRMAFATVAGQTVAVMSSIAAVVITVKRRLGGGGIVLFLAIAALITLTAIAAVTEASSTLLVRLDLVDETNLLNR